MAPSISLNQSKRTTLIVETRLLKISEVRDVVSRIGRGEIGAHADPINSAEVFVLLHPEAEWREAQNQEEIEGVIRHELGEVPTGVSRTMRVAGVAENKPGKSGATGTR
jgi:cobalt-zinc-cadmium resistance protein CzcA